MGNVAMSISEAADQIGVSTATIRRKVKTGELEAIHLGSRVLITMDALRRLLKLDPTRVGSETRPSGRSHS